MTKECFCCKKEKEGTVIDGRWCCNDCNHLEKKDETKKQKT